MKNLVLAFSVFFLFIIMSYTNNTYGQSGYYRQNNAANRAQDELDDEFHNYKSDAKAAEARAREAEARANALQDKLDAKREKEARDKIKTEVLKYKLQETERRANEAEERAKEAERSKSTTIYVTKQPDTVIYVTPNDAEETYREGRRMYSIKNYARAAKLYRLSCDAGFTLACNRLGEMYEYGIGLHRDRYKAAEFYKFSCENSSEEGCRNYGRMVRKGIID